MHVSTIKRLGTIFKFGFDEVFFKTVNVHELYDKN